MTDEDDIDDLRAKTRGTDRIGTESDEEDESGEAVPELDAGDVVDDDAVPELEVAPTDGFAEALATASDRARTGVLPRSYSGDEPTHGGLFETLRERPEDAERVAAALAAAADVEPPDDVDKPTLVDLAVAAGLRTAAPAYHDALEDARR